MECHTIQKRALCTPAKSFDWLVCCICGGRDGHWNGFPNSFSPPPKLCYDSSVICKVEDPEQESHNMDLLKLLMVRLDIIILAIMEQRSKRMEQQAKIDTYKFDDVEKEYKSENVLNNVALELRLLGPHSKHFFCHPTIWRRRKPTNEEGISIGVSEGEKVRLREEEWYSDVLRNKSIKDESHYIKADITTKESLVDSMSRMQCQCHHILSESL
ncbi:hypothetical protein H5410_022611 [Solanum commersonii]|uniref:Uncharacterized protein n=1 Tax=Solanum commersonii TaxID=4109 RepID=A0A9J5ZFA9_SOLCO|nr:hypothetical protein H5410_022611 [Solanum commersonii]